MKTSTYEDSEPVQEFFVSSNAADVYECNAAVNSFRGDNVDSLQSDSVHSLPSDPVETIRNNVVDSFQCYPVISPHCEPIDSLRCNLVDTRQCDFITTSEPADVSHNYSVNSPQCSDSVHVPQYEVCNTELVSPEEVSVRKVEAYRAERWRDSQEDAETVTSDTDPTIAQFEPISEMYYTASSEVSLLSDLDIPDKVHLDEDVSIETGEKAERKECVIAGHVAAMRERFESMTRTNTPCPDLMRSMSPSLDVFRNITPSPDRLG